MCNTVDGRNPTPVEVGSLSHYLQGFLHRFGGCLRISEASTVSPPREYAPRFTSQRGAE